MDDPGGRQIYVMDADGAFYQRRLTNHNRAEGASRGSLLVEPEWAAHISLQDTVQRFLERDGNGEIYVMDCLL